MKLALAMVTAALVAPLLATSASVYAQAPKAEAGKAQARHYDCSKAKDPKACEERLAKLRERREKARKACEGKAGAEHRECMEKAWCADEKDPAQCEARVKAAVERREQIREACKGKAGEELKACIREQRGAKK